MFALAAYLHRIDPFALRFPDWIPIDGIRWYGLSYLVGFLIGYLLIRRVAQTGRSTIKVPMAADLVVAIAIGLVVGGRLGYALFYHPQLLISFSGSFPWWDLLALNKGGMASHGGMVGGIVATWWYARRHDHSWPHLLDLAAFAAPLGLCFGRIANFINGELIGRATTESNPFAVKYPQEIEVLPARVIEPVIARVDQLGLFRGYVDPSREALVDLVYRGSADAIALVEPLLTPRHPSQIYQALLEGLLLFVILAVVWMRPRKPGVVGGAFAAGYGVLRIVGEFFREPDTHIGYQWLQLTRGQWLSVALVGVGIALLWTMSRRAVEPMGGWRKQA